MRIFRPWGEVDWGNQVAHVAVGAAVTAVLIFALGFILPAGLAHSLSSMAMITFAVWREVIWQHPNECGEGCRTDLAGWILGILIANVLATLFLQALYGLLS